MKNPHVGLVAILVFFLTGCVERVMIIRTNPADSSVFIDGNLVGKTPPDGNKPLETKFTWYGNVNMIVEKPGYKTIETVQSVPIPWFQIFPLSILVDVFLPFNVRDNREFNFKLEKYSITDDIEDLKRGLDNAKNRLK